MTRDHETAADRDLEVFFQAARQETAEPSPDLLARVLADAYAGQETLVAVAAPAPEPARRKTLLRGVFDGLGGWPAMAGLVTATAAGLWIGYNPPASFETLTLPLFGSGYDLTMGSSLPDIDFLLADG